jgi:hypothetical protein
MSTVEFEYLKESYNLHIEPRAGQISFCKIIANVKQLKI